MVFAAFPVTNPDIAMLPYYATDRQMIDLIRTVETSKKKEANKEQGN